MLITLSKSMVLGQSNGGNVYYLTGLKGKHLFGPVSTLAHFSRPNFFEHVFVLVR